MASRRFEDLQPPARSRAEKFVVLCANENIDVLVYCTLRSSAEQNELYTHGRMKPGPVVTYARGGFSLHNFGLAFDFVPLILGKPAWNNEALYHLCGKIGEGLGLTWGGSWQGKKKDEPHLQYDGGNTLAEIRSGVVVV